MVDRIVAIVNQEIITLSEVDKLIAPVRDEIQTENRLERDEKLRELRLKALDRLVEEKVLDYEAKKAGIRVTSKEVDTIIEDIKQRSNATQEDLENALAREGMTYEKLQERDRETAHPTETRPVVDQSRTEGGRKRAAGIL